MTHILKVSKHIDKLILSTNGSIEHGKVLKGIIEEIAVDGDLNVFDYEHSGFLMKGEEEGYEFANIIDFGNYSFINVWFKRNNHHLSKQILENLDKILFTTFNASHTQSKSHVGYSMVTSFALSKLDLEQKTVLDIGAAEGRQTLLALRKGAKRVYCIEKEEVAQNSMYLTHDAGLNEIDANNFKYIYCNINKFNYKKFIDRLRKTNGTPTICNVLPLEKIDLAVANIGPEYKETHLNVIKLSRYMPNLTTFVLGGYLNVAGKHGTDSATIELEKYGFSITKKYILDDSNIALVAERNN